MCLLHHVQRIDSRISLFDTYWFVMVTLSTVGYGDISPSHWTGKLLVTIFIVAALVLLVPQLEELYETFQLQQKLQNSVSYTQAEKHIIICSSFMKPLVLRDFLTEFYADPTHYVSPEPRLSFDHTPDHTPYPPGHPHGGDGGA